jgi:carbon-monoxide dehydrogenase medium subunit
VKPAPFEYVRPRDLAELFDTLADGDVLLAGGQSLVPQLNERKRQPRRLIDINAIAELHRVDVGPDTVVLGALTRHQALVDNPEVRAAVPLVSCAAAHVGHAAVRTRGTLGGSLANADPAAELPGVCVLLGATVALRSPEAARVLGVVELLRCGGPADREVIVAIEVPRPATPQAWGFREISRPGGYAFPLVTVAAMASLAVEGTVAAVRAVVAGAAPVPYVVDVPADGLPGGETTHDWYESVVDRLVAGADPVDDLHASAAYRRRLIRHLTHQVLADAIGRAEAVAA